MSYDAVRATGVGKRFKIHASPAHRLANYASFGRICRPNTFWAVSGVDLTVTAGSTLGILGVNGSGKSTLLQMICGTLSPTTGRIETRGRIAALLELGAGFNPEFTGRENVRLSLLLAGLSPDAVNARMPWVLDFSGIAEHFDMPVRTYSSGMFVRLAFAAAVATDPDILVIDEALSVGDVGFQQKCFRYLREDLREATKIIVTHDMQSAALCDRIVVLDQGGVIFDGPASTGVERYLGRYRRWRVAPPPVKGKAGVTIKAAAIAVNGAPMDVVRAGDDVKVRVSLRAETEMPVVVKLRWESRYGAVVLCQSADQHMVLPAGSSRFEASFKWPDIMPKEYLLTAIVKSPSGAVICQALGLHILTGLEPPARPPMTAPFASAAIESAPEEQVQ